MSDLLNDPLLTSVPAHEGYKVLGSVVLYQKIGAGGMSAVFLGRHLRLDIDVALKVLTPPPILPGVPVDDCVKRFLREARVAAHIRHQNLIRVIDVNTEHGVYYLTMDFIDGESTKARVMRKGPLSEAEAVDIIMAAAEGLAEAHQQGFVHRDVKADNILIDKKGRVCVADLGLARAFEQDEEGANAASMVTGTQTILGTPAYMPPEQFKSAIKVGPPGDVWALGVTLYYLLTGKVPWIDSSVFTLAMKITNEPMPDLRSVRPDATPGVAAIIMRACQKDPAQRYKDAGEMAAALNVHRDSLAAQGGKAALEDPKAGSQAAASIKASPPPQEVLTRIVAMTMGGGTPEAMPDQERFAETVAGGAGKPTPKAATAGAAPATARFGRAWNLLVPLIALAIAAAGITAWAYRPRGTMNASAQKQKQANQDTPVSPAAEEKQKKERDACMASAEAAERAGDLEAEAGHLREASKYGAEVAARLADVETRIAEKKRVEAQEQTYRSAAAEARTHQREGRWQEVAAAAQKALNARPGDGEAAAMLAEARNRLTLSKEFTNTIGMKLVLIPAGEFPMGSPETEKERAGDEGPQHTVKITRPYYMGATEVTQGQWQAVMGTNPSNFKGDNLPVENVSWSDCHEFLKKLSAREGQTYRLPTEAEWEYACRAGTTAPFNTGETIGTDQANYDGNEVYVNGVKGEFRQKTTPAGKFNPNSWGLYDMHGNVWEWCEDWYDKDYYRNSPAADPTGPAQSTGRVLRGGSWSVAPKCCRSAFRFRYGPDFRYVDVGFRAVALPTFSRTPKRMR
jgi:formylglycine-generating enzyme required for sulfatase activity